MSLSVGEIKFYIIKSQTVRFKRFTIIMLSLLENI